MDNQFEKQILLSLETINFKLDRQNETLKNHEKILNAHSEILNSHSEILNSHSETLNSHSDLLKKQDERLANLEEIQRLQAETLKEQTSLVSSLKNGQESLKAEISQLRLQNAQEFGEIKEQLKGIEDNFDLLREEVWMNKKDIKRIQKTMGMC